MRLTQWLAILMGMQAALGLSFADQYRDAAWIRATWFGNDWFTLVIAAPMLWLATRLATSSIRAELIRLGTLGYAVYNYAFYLFGAALNVFLPLYVIIEATGIAALLTAFGRIDATQVQAAVSPGASVRVVGAYLTIVAGGLATVWIAMWAAYVFAGRPTPVDPEAFKIVAALDLLWLVPSLGAGGVMLWHRRPYGFVIAPAAAVQGTLYLLVLALNSVIAIERGLVAPPGELAIWGPLAVLTMGAGHLLLKSIVAMKRQHEG